MKTVTLYIGHNVNGTPTLTASGVCESIETVLGVEAYTIAEARGMWRGEAEETTVATIAALEDSEAARIVELVPVLCAVLEQEAIGCEVRENAMVFIGADWNTAEETA